MDIDGGKFVVGFFEGFGGVGGLVGMVYVRAGG